MRETARTSGIRRHLYRMYVKSFGADGLLVVMSCNLMINIGILIIILRSLGTLIFSNITHNKAL